MNILSLKELVDELIQLPSETEWVEFKQNFHSQEEIGKTISALSNGACLHNKKFGYLVFGIEDNSHKITGTTFNVKSHKIGNDNLELWLNLHLNPRIDFEVFEFDYETEKHISLYKIPAAKNQPISFNNVPYIRIASSTTKLSNFPDKQSRIWRKEDIAFEREIAMDGLQLIDIPKYLSTETYFDLLKIQYPSNLKSIIDKFIDEGLVVHSNPFAITKLGALLFAKNLSDFDSISRKSIRVIVYKGKNKVETEREQIGIRGYAIGFSGLLDWINSQLPANEEIGKALRTNTRMYPEIAIRELVANALVHQDLREKGFPMIEIFKDRIEISNSGVPLVTPERFIDAYLSRNEKLADLMRRLGFCEEKGSGLDKVIFNNELYQLPPINVIVDDNRTRITLYSYKSLNDLDKKEKVRACYQHACLKYVSNEKMTNQSLRERFKIEDHNYSTASRIIRDALEEKVIKEDDPLNKSRKFASYIPIWA